MLARHHTTLPRCDCIGTLRGLYKDSLMCSNPLGFRLKQGIKLPSGYRVLAKPNSLLEQVYTPSPATPSPLSGKAYHTLRYLIIQKRQSHMSCGCTLFLGGRSMLPLMHDNLVSKHRQKVVRDTSLSPKISYSYCSFFSSCFLETLYLQSE